MGQTNSAELRPGEIVRSSINLRAILNHLGVDKNLGRVVILGSGEGGWPKVVATGTEYTTEWIHSYLWSRGNERPGLYFHHPRVTVKTQDIGSVKPYRCDTLLCNMQPGSVESELRNLDIIEDWLALDESNNYSIWNYFFKLRFLFIIRVMNHDDWRVREKLDYLSKRFESGQQIIMNTNEIYFVSGPSGKIGKITLKYFIFRKPRLNGIWPIPDKLPDGVVELAPLDIGATLTAIDNIQLPMDYGNRIFMKELGWVSCNQPNLRDSHNKNRVFKKLIEPIISLIDDHDKWIITSNSPDTIDRTIREKIDHAPQENHQYHEYLWEAYKAIAVYLRETKGCRVSRWSDDELGKKVKNKQSSMGWQDRDLECENMGEYLKKPQVWKPEVEDFRKNLLAGRPIKGIFSSCGKRERKKEDKTRIVWSLGATGRLYEAQVLGSADNLLYKLPYTIKGALPHNYGEIFEKMLDKKPPRHAVCDDIKGFDTKVSYSILCMESAFLQLLSDDEEHRKEIEHMYRLYAYPVVRIVEKYYTMTQIKYRRVFYQLQGQRMSGCRGTSTMNTITNIVVTMSRAAWSQGVKLDKLGEWVKGCLMGQWHSDKYGGKIYGDDTVIVLGKRQARLFAGHSGADFMNAIGFIRKNTGRENSKVVESIRDIDFCSRKFVPFTYTQEERHLTRLMPIRRTADVIMKKLLRKDPGTEVYELAWAREQAFELLLEYFHVPSLRLLALAILSATPKNIVLTEDGQISILSYLDEARFSIQSTLKKINQRYKMSNAAKDFNDLDYISTEDRKIYDLDIESTIYKRWKSNGLQSIICSFREKKYTYDDWIPKERDVAEPIPRLQVQSQGEYPSVQMDSFREPKANSSSLTRIGRFREHSIEWPYSLYFTVAFGIFMVGKMIGYPLLMFLIFMFVCYNKPLPKR